MKSKEPITCCFCGCKIDDGFGNNPEPLKSHPNRCCDKCNMEIVIPERIEHVKNTGMW